MTEATVTDYRGDAYQLGHFAYSDQHGHVYFGFLLGVNTTEGRANLDENLYELVIDMVAALGIYDGHYDFELARAAIDAHGKAQIAFLCKEGSYIMLRDDGQLHDTLEKLAKATQSGNIQDFNINVDLVEPDPKRLKLISFFEEMTGDMS